MGDTERDFFFCESCIEIRFFFPELARLISPCILFSHVPVFELLLSPRKSSLAYGLVPGQPFLSLLREE